MSKIRYISIELVASFKIIDLGLDDKAIRAFCMSILKQFVY